MRTELANLSTAYLMGWKTIRDCAEWLAGIDWDDPSLDSESLNFVGRLELLATEVLEGLRPESDFWQESAEFVARETNLLYSQPPLVSNFTVASSSSTSTARIPEFIGLGVGVSQSWSISPLLVSV